MIAQAMGLSSDRQYFSDVPAGAWYAGAVNAMAELGIVDGVGGGKFAPLEPMSREQYLTVIARLSRFLNASADGTWSDLSQTELDAAGALGFTGWARPGGALLERLGLLYADPAGLDLTGGITREEAGAQLYRVLAGLDFLPD